MLKLYTTKLIEEITQDDVKIQALPGANVCNVLQTMALYLMLFWLK